ncbi:MAG: FAD-dependent oxidoreductase [Clostridia bacterium]|nr:FAD-dependent oxidoreductase [Clostridia bacterium]
MNRMKKLLALFCAMLMLATGAFASETAQTVTGSASGMGEVTVELTVEGGVITQALVDTGNETPGIGQGLGEELARQILEAQGSDIEGISGATVTSAAAKAAAAQALARAGVVSQAASMTPGVYVGSARGAKSDIKMAVEVDESSILNVWNLENNDTAIISALAVNTVAENIVAEQSLAVDTVTGATLTSRAAILAVSEALDKAGADTSSLMASSPKEKTVRETEQYDVVVVGGGTSGMTAALSAKTDSGFGLTDSGLSVLVVERNGFAGGDMGFCGGYIATPSGNPLSEATGAEMTPEQVTEAMLGANPNAAAFASETVSLNVWQRGPATITGLMNRGFHLTVEDARVVTLGGHETTAAFTLDPVTGYRCGDDWYDAMTGAPYLAATLARAIEDAGVEMRLSTEATGLIVEDNVCTGIMVEDRDSIYQINAKKVILATGYGGFDAESVEMFYPEVSNVVAGNNSGNHSDAQKWIREMGGEVIYYPDANYIVPVYNAVLRDNYEVGYLFQRGRTMWVNSNGERFFDESQILNNGLTDTGALLRTLDDGFAYMIFDDANEDCARYAGELIDNGVAWSASSVSELAAKTGLPEDALAATIESYNAACESGIDEQFATPADFMSPISSTTIYAARIAPGSTASMPLSVYVDEDMTITLTQHGQRIENLLAAGGVCGNIVPVTGFGAHVYEALSSGTYAGECARVAILGE